MPHAHPSPAQDLCRDSVSTGAHRRTDARFLPVCHAAGFGQGRGVRTVRRMFRLLVGAAECRSVFTNQPSLHPQSRALHRCAPHLPHAGVRETPAPNAPGCGLRTAGERVFVPRWRGRVGALRLTMAAGRRTSRARPSGGAAVGDVEGVPAAAGQRGPRHGRRLRDPLAEAGPGGAVEGVEGDL